MFFNVAALSLCGFVSISIIVLCLINCLSLFFVFYSNSEIIWQLKINSLNIILKPNVKLYIQSVNKKKLKDVCHKQKYISLHLCNAVKASNPILSSIGNTICFDATAKTENTKIIINTKIIQIK